MCKSCHIITFVPPEEYLDKLQDLEHQVDQLNNRVDQLLSQANANQRDISDLQGRMQRVEDTTDNIDRSIATLPDTRRQLQELTQSVQRIGLGFLAFRTWVRNVIATIGATFRITARLPRENPGADLFNETSSDEDDNEFNPRRDIIEV